MIRAVRSAQTKVVVIAKEGLGRPHAIADPDTRRGSIWFSYVVLIS